MVQDIGHLSSYEGSVTWLIELSVLRAIAIIDFYLMEIRFPFDLSYN